MIYPVSNINSTPLIIASQHSIFCLKKYTESRLEFVPNDKKIHFVSQRSSINIYENK